MTNCGRSRFHFLLFGTFVAIVLTLLLTTQSRGGKASVEGAIVRVGAVEEPSATPTMAAPTTTPTATATFVPTAVARYPLYIPVLLRQQSPLLRNGDFEMGSVYWAEESSLQYRLIVSSTELQPMIPHMGRWAAWLGGKNNETSELSQRVFVSPQTPILAYWYSILAEDDCGLDIATILIDDEPYEQIHLCKTANVAWTLRVLDLSRYQGNVVTLRFRVDTDRDGQHSNFFLDDISFRATSVQATY